MILRPGTRSQSYNIFIADRTGTITGTAGDGVTGLTAATMPQMFWFRDNEAAVDFPTLVDLGSLDAPYTEGGVFERGGGYYRVDGPDAMIAVFGMVTIDSDDATREPIYDDIQVTGLPIPSTTGDAAGYYADETDLRDYLGTLNLAIESNLENDTTDEDTDRIQRALDDADAWIDVGLGGSVFAVPLTNMGAATAKVVGYVATVYAADYLLSARLLQAVGGDKTAKQISELIAAAVADADGVLAKMRVAPEQFTADLAVTDIAHYPTHGRR